MNRKHAPYITVIQGDVESDPMTTDVAIEQFDFGEHTEATLDAIVESMEPGEVEPVRCEYSDEPTPTAWTIQIRRID